MGKYEPGSMEDTNDISGPNYYGGNPDAARSDQESKCFIAAAVYGDIMAPEVVSLRKFRDEVLKKYSLGRIFISTYYASSPPVAHWLKTKPRLSRVVRIILNKFVQWIK